MDEMSDEMSDEKINDYEYGKCHNCYRETREIYSLLENKLLVCKRCRPPIYLEYERVNFMTTIPNEMILHIISFMDGNDLSNFRYVTRNAYNLVKMYFESKLNQFIELDREFPIGREYYIYDWYKLKKCDHKRNNTISMVNKNEITDVIYCYKCQMAIQKIWIYGVYERDGEYYIVYDRNSMGGIKETYFHDIYDFRMKMRNNLIMIKID